MNRQTSRRFTPQSAAATKAAGPSHPKPSRPRADLGKPRPHPRFPAGVRVRVEPAPEVRRTAALLELIGRVGVVEASGLREVAVRFPGWAGVRQMPPAALVRVEG